MTFEVRLEYNKFFLGEIPDIYACLSGIEKKLLIECCLTLIHAENELKKPEEFIKVFFSSSNHQLKDNLLSKYLTIKENDTSSNEHTWIIQNIEALLLLLEKILLLPNEKTTKDLNTIEEDFFKSILIINSSLGTREDSLPKFENVNDIDKYFSALAYSRFLTYNDYFNINLSLKVLSQFVKAIHFFEFCEKNSKYKKILTIFLKKYNCENWKTYINRLITISNYLIDADLNNKTPKIELNPQDKSYIEDKKFFDALTLDQKNKEFSYDFTRFRECPLIKINENEYQIICKSFLAEKIYSSVFYNFNEINKTLDADIKIKDFFQDFTTNFSEKCLFLSVLNKIFKRRCCIKYSDAEFKEKGFSDGVPDFYVRNGNKVFLFETKDLKFSAEIKQSLDFDKIEKYLQKKLLKKDNGSDTGIGQLINSIKKLAINEFPVDNNYKANKLMIYPILVLNDPIYCLPGFNYILNLWFQKGISDVGLDHMQIKPLVVIDIDTLIYYQEAFAKKKINLENELISYYKFIKNQTPYPPEEIINNALHHQLSFSDYLNDKIKYKDYPSEAFHDYIKKYISDL